MPTAKLAALSDGAPLDGVALADLLWAALAHERQGVHLYRALEAFATAPSAMETFGRLAADAVQTVHEYA